MTLADRINEISTNVASGIALTVVSGAVWLVRRVFTNERLIQELVKENQRRDDQRKEDLSNMTNSIKRVEASVDTLTKHLLEAK